MRPQEFGEQSFRPRGIELLIGDGAGARTDLQQELRGVARIVANSQIAIPA
jgi:hypothetical protein